MKYVVITGGVISGVGKGVIASSTGVLLKSRGLRVTAIKIDPYLNIDAGTLTPYDHGEVFVLDDGGEVDLDLGNYERFLDITLTKENNITTGKIYRSVIEKERRGDFLGKTVQVVPHITDAIQDWIDRVSIIPVDDSMEVPDVCIIELGGTVGDIESAPFIEALRQFQFRVGHENFFLIHVSLVPVIGSSAEQKTKPTQASVRDLRGLGLSPDVIACRSSKPLEKATREKLAMFCHVPPTHIFAVHDCKSLYHVPLVLEAQRLLEFLETRLNFASISSHTTGIVKNYFESWKNMTDCYENLHLKVKISIVGKYTSLSDAYLSVTRALQHASVASNRQIEISWIEASDLEDAKSDNYESSWQSIKSADGIIVPGGFGERGTYGKILACNYARTNKVPYLGICLGLQIAVIEFARNVLGLTDAHSEEFSTTTSNPVVIFMPEVSKTQMGGTMRLGIRATKLVKPSVYIQKLYDNQSIIYERHRHRYEVNPIYVSQLENNGLLFVGQDEEGQRMEIIELAGHPFFVATQFHPEFKSRPLRPSPLFLGFIKASSGQPILHAKS